MVFDKVKSQLLLLLQPKTTQRTIFTFSLTPYYERICNYLLGHQHGGYQPSSRQKSRGWKLRIPAKMYINEKGEK